MRFIGCARYKEEQNLYAIQYDDNIFYRAFKDIAVGTEMLVWYDESYMQYMGIPLQWQETKLSTKGVFNTDLNRRILRNVLKTLFNIFWNRYYLAELSGLKFC